MAKFDANRYIRGANEGADKNKADRDDARNKFADAYQSAVDQYQGKVQSNADAVAGLQRQKERAGNLNWGDEIMAGAGAGSAAGPWGALIGGAIGATSGLITYGKEADKYGGQDFGDFLLGGVPTMNAGNTAAASGLAGQLGGRIDQNNMMEALQKRKLATGPDLGAQTFEPSGPAFSPQSFEASGPAAGTGALFGNSQYGPYASQGPTGGAPPGGEFDAAELFPRKKPMM